MVERIQTCTHRPLPVGFSGQTPCETFQTRPSNRMWIRPKFRVSIVNRQDLQQFSFRDSRCYFIASLLASTESLTQTLHRFFRNFFSDCSRKSLRNSSGFFSVYFSGILSRISPGITSELPLKIRSPSLPGVRPEIPPVIFKQILRRISPEYVPGNLLRLQRQPPIISTNNTL